MRPSSPSTGSSPRRARAEELAKLHRHRDARNGARWSASEDHGGVTARSTKRAARARRARARGLGVARARRRRCRAHPGPGRPLRPTTPTASSRVESYGERIARGRHRRARPASASSRSRRRWRKSTATTASGPLVGMRALEAAMASARELGVGLALARNSNHFGAVGPYCWLAAEAGLRQHHRQQREHDHRAHRRHARRASATARSASACPNPGGRPFILDMAMSVVARAKIRAAAKRGEPIPDTWATDREGAHDRSRRPRSMASCCPSAATRATGSRSRWTSSRACSPAPPTSPT